MATQESVVVIEELNHYYGTGNLRQQVLYGINLKIQPQEFVMLMGPSGSGKSTLLSLIGCLRTVQDGSLRVLGKELRGANKQGLTEIRRNYAFIPQRSNLINFLTVRQNIFMSLELQSGLSKREMNQRTVEMLDSVGLKDFIDAYPENLSGGQRQRVAIASALASRPQLLLADEPTAALDKKSGRNAVALMHRLAKEQGSAVLVVTHDNRILDLADRIINVEDGHLGLALSQEVSLALPGVDETILEQAQTKPIAMTYSPSEVIIQQGDPATKFYILLEGEVDIVQEFGDQPERLLARRGRGEYFGEIGLLEGGTRTATVRAAETSEAKVMVISEELFQAIMKNSELTSSFVANQLRQRVMRSYLTKALPEMDVALLDKLGTQAKLIRYGEGSNIVQAGQLPENFYLVIKGSVGRVFMANGEISMGKYPMCCKLGTTLGNKRFCMVMLISTP
jgi:sulfate-transporting ATPase